MFGKRKTVPAGPEFVSVSAPLRPAPKSPSESLKPVAPPPPPPRVKRPRGGLLSLMSGLMTLGLVVSATLVFGLLILDREADQPGPLQADKVVFIPKGSGSGEIAELLAREGVIKNPTLFQLYALLKSGKGQSLKAGEFQFKAGSDIAETIETLVEGKAILHAFTVPEGLTSEQIVERIRENDILVGPLNDVPREGSLMPDTYRLERGTTRQSLVNMMQAEARRALADAWSKRAPDLPIRTAPELVILASIVEKETGRPDERARVAGAFVNRLQRRMKLQSDPTIVYGLVGGKGTLGRGITRAEIERGTPYNTYVIEGLPPGPIANPGRAALLAAANPMKTRDVYFVADGTGGHAFAETYEQHLRNVARWRQVERSREAAAAAPVDRAEPPPSPDGRTEGPGGPRAAAFDASEGTARDPLRNQGWDLTTAKTVPGFGPPPGDVGPGRAAQPAPAPRRREPTPRGARAEAARPSEPR